jgi:hypothetical protein
MSLPGVGTATVSMLEGAGISPAWIYAYQHTDGLLPRPDGSFTSERDSAEWHDAVDQYMKLHQAASPVDHEAETRKLQNVLIAVTLKMAADDTEYAASLAARLMAHETGVGADSESALLRQYLHAWAEDLTAKVRGDPAI